MKDRQNLSFFDIILLDRSGCTMGRYTLRVYDNKTKQEQIVKIVENNRLKTKLDITTIDIFILENACFGLTENVMLKDEETGKTNFINYLNSTITQKEPAIKNHISNDSLIYITYENSGRKFLEPVYKNINLLNIAKEFSELREKYSQYKEKYPNSNKEELARKHDDIFEAILYKPFFSNWIKTFYQDLDKRNISHDINSDRRYLNASFKNAIMNLAYALPYRNYDLETAECNRSIDEWQKDVEKKLMSYKQTRGLVILCSIFWNQKSVIANNSYRGVTSMQKTVGSRDVEKAIKLFHSKKQPVEEPLEMEEENKPFVIDNDGIVYTKMNGNQVYFDHFDEEYEEYQNRQKEQQEDYLEVLNIDNTDEDDPDIVRTTLHDKPVIIDHTDENAWAKKKRR